MTEEQFAELYAMNLFSQDQFKSVSAGNERQTWDELTRKERDAYRRIADKLLKEIE